MSQIPSSLQPVLWSVNVDHLDRERDKSYIIHQILSYGTLDEINWVFQNYGKNEISDTFTHQPYKDYRPARFHFVKNYLLDLKNQPLDERHYVKNIPRDIGQA